MDNATSTMTLSGRRRFWFIFTLLTGTWTMSISQSSLSTVYPTFMRDFGISASTVQWLTTGFMLTMVVMMPISPWLLDNIGFKKLFLTVLVLFDVGSIIIYFAPSFPVMMVGRLIKAAAVGVLFPSYQSILLTITPEEERGTTMGVAGLVMGSALASGPIISGIVLKFTDWHGLFLVFITVATILILVSFYTINDVMVSKPSKLDTISIVMLLGFAGILYVVNEIGKSGVDWTLNGILLVVSILAVAYFTYRQFHLTTPLLELRVLKTFNYDLAIFLTAISYIALIVVTIVFPLYYQGVLKVSPFISGMSLVPGAVFLSILNPLTGKLAEKFGYKQIMLLGMTMIVVGWLILTLITTKLNLLTMILIAAIIEGGNAFVMMPAVTLGANSLPDALISHGTAVITTVRQILGSAGVAVATLILSNVTAAQLKSGVPSLTANLNGYHAVFVTMLGVEIVGLILALLLRDGRQANKQ
ncbi:MFS transporter [Lactiplantibacillus fabifermentans]|uniref:MFS transporter n=2 Tax=Lactiplantibacillus fabifermentans TaxID=483011 RepID=W6TBR3_9LACO|nr:MFS transporter [Lactiplantibacillus fabifermentans]ETY73090.1 MFS transporter [Lactiplantibacillus fabifermentans T30PCM01]